METASNSPAPRTDASAHADPTAGERCACRGGEARPTCLTRCRRFVPSSPQLVAVRMGRAASL